jgi:hypothetical protein
MEKDKVLLVADNFLKCLDKLKPFDPKCDPSLISMLIIGSTLFQKAMVYAIEKHFGLTEKLGFLNYEYLHTLKNSYKIEDIEIKKSSNSFHLNLNSGFKSPLSLKNLFNSIVSDLSFAGTNPKDQPRFIFFYGAENLSPEFLNYLRDEGDQIKTAFKLVILTNKDVDPGLVSRCAIFIENENEMTNIDVLDTFGHSEKILPIEFALGVGNYLNIILPRICQLNQQLNLSVPVICKIISNYSLHLSEFIISSPEPTRTFEEAVTGFGQFLFIHKNLAPMNSLFDSLIEITSDCSNNFKKQSVLVQKQMENQLFFNFCKFFLHLVEINQK